MKPNRQQQAPIRVRASILPGGSLGVDLPQYNELPGSWLPLVDGLIGAHGALPGVDLNDVVNAGASVAVLVPVSFLADDGKSIDPDRVRDLYFGIDPWGSDDYKVRT